MLYSYLDILARSLLLPSHIPGVQSQLAKMKVMKPGYLRANQDLLRFSQPNHVMLELSQRLA